jgi:hypothetical protein
LAWGISAIFRLNSIVPVLFSNVSEKDEYLLLDSSKEWLGDVFEPHRTGSRTRGRTGDSATGPPQRSPATKRQMTGEEALSIL